MDGDRPRRAPTSSTPLCPTTPGGVPIRLLVDAEPRSRARRALPIVLLVALAAGIAAVALAGCGAPAAPSPRGARVEAGPAGGVPRAPPFAPHHVAALLERAE